MTNEDLAKLIEEGREETRVLISTIHEGNQKLAKNQFELQQTMHKDHRLLAQTQIELLKTIQKDNADWRVEFRQLLERLIWPGDN